MKVIVAHPFQQHSFQTAAAVKKSGHLYKYITTVYLKDCSLTSFIGRFLRGDNKNRVQGRKSAEISDDEVVLLSEWANLLLLLLQRVDRSKKLYNWWYWKTLTIFNSALFKYVKKNDIDVVVVYDTVSAHFIKKIKKSKLKTKIIVDMSAPNANYMRHIFNGESKNIPDYAHEDLKDISSQYFINKCKSVDIELKNADAFLVASDFTKKSLLWAHVPDKKIFKCVYGIYDGKKTNYLDQKSKDIIKCCFIGKVCMQKGAYRLFNVIDKLERNDIEFHFFGSYSKEKNYYEKFKSKCIFHGHVPHEKMLSELERMDIVVFPSFADGFGFSVTEGLSKNNIAICSKNAGVSEIIIPGENGYTYNPEDEDGLLDILQSLDKTKLCEMQRKTKETLESYSWAVYGSNLNAAIMKVCGK